MPTSRVNRKFGIEIEISNRHISREDIQEKLEPFVVAEGHTLSHQEAGNYWTLKTDGSCGYEVTTPALASSARNFEAVHRIIHGFRRSIAGQHVIDRRCGLHVHFSIMDFEAHQIKNLINTFRSYEDVLISLQPPSRHQNSYTERIKTNESLVRSMSVPNFSMRNMPLINHYSGLNFNRYSQRKTIEIRYGAGSIRENKIVNWVQTLLFLVEHAKRVDNASFQDKTLIDLKNLIESSETHSWLDQRKGAIHTWLQRRYDELNNRDIEETA
jgi:hypothetical protein